jgi:hypothetical protein
MKRNIIIALIALSSTALYGASNQPVFIKGTMEIKFNSRVQLSPEGKVQPGIRDSYRLDLNFSDSAKIAGTITNTPAIYSETLGLEKQAGQLDYRLDLSVVNPANPSQQRSVGNITGTLPVDRSGAYRFSDGSLRIGVNATGRAAGFESRFTGTAIGKQPESSSLISKLKKDAIKLTKQVQGKTIAIVVNNYDKMQFISHGLAQGPVSSYTDSQVNGEMLYDYERSVWYFQGVTISYTSESKPVNDKLTGNIRWIEKPRSGATRDGEYQFDVRFNEPVQNSNESAVFTAAADENSFFESDPKISSVVGSMKYKDTFAGDNVSMSAIVVDLNGNQVTRQQAMNLFKLIFVSAVVPFNSE